jgi:hypothetical protein
MTIKDENTLIKTGFRHPCDNLFRLKSELLSVGKKRHQYRIEYTIYCYRFHCPSAPSEITDRCLSSHFIQLK